MKQIDSIVDDTTRISLLISLLVFLTMTSIISYTIKPHQLLLENYTVFLAISITCTTIATILLAERIDDFIRYYSGLIQKHSSILNTDDQRKLVLFENRVENISKELQLLKSIWLFNLATISLSSILYILLIVSTLIRFANGLCITFNRTYCNRHCTSLKTRDIVIAYISLGLLLPAVITARIKCPVRVVREIELTVTRE